MIRRGVLHELDYGLAAQGVVFDPGTLMAVSLGASAAGGATSAVGTLMSGGAAAAAGDMQQSADNYQAAQLTEDSGTAIGVAQGKMLDREHSTNMLLSTLRARASGGGLATSSPTIVEDAGAIGQKGRYDAMMDLWQGTNQASGMLNQATGLRYSGQIAEAAGQMQEEDSNFAAAGTLMSTAGGMAKTYGAFTYPNASGRPGIGFYG
jgi:hypothetical protein